MRSKLAVTEETVSSVCRSGTRSPLGALKDRTGSLVISTHDQRPQSRFSLISSSQMSYSKRQVKFGLDTLYARHVALFIKLLLNYVKCRA